MKKSTTENPVRIGVLPSLFFLLFLALGGSNAAAEVKGPDFVNAGELAVFSSDEPAAWAVIPASYAEAVYIDTGGKTLIFASPKEGTVSIIAATATDGAANIEIHTFINGEKSDGNEPLPQPGSLEEIVRNELDKIQNKQTAEAGREKLAGVFQTVIDGIDKGTIRSPEGARETFRRYWEYEAAQAGAGTLEAYRPLLSSVSSQIDWTDVQTVRGNFEVIKKALKW